MIRSAVAAVEGCLEAQVNGSGGFFCFSNNTPPVGPALAAGSSLSFDFDVNATGIAS